MVHEEGCPAIVIYTFVTALGGFPSDVVLLTVYDHQNCEFQFLTSLPPWKISPHATGLQIRTYSDLKPRNKKGTVTW